MPVTEGHLQPYAVRNLATGDVKAEGEILYGASYVQRFAGKARRIHGDIVASSPGSQLLIVKLLMAVVACLSPWNFSNAMPARENAPALASGCTVVCKPADETPLSALAFGELAMRVEIPVGAINIISGRTSEIGAEPASTRKIRKLALAGSTPVGKN